MPELQQIRSDPERRSDFLSDLCRAATRGIGVSAVNASETKLSVDYIKNECTQAFLSAANGALDSFNGTGTLEGWCNYKGLLGVCDFVRNDMGARRKRTPKVVMAEDLYATFRDPRNYEDAITSTMTVQEIVSHLSPIDRSIVELLVFGCDQFGTLRNGGLFGEYRVCIAKSIAHTIGIPEPLVYARIAAIRKKLKKEVRL